MSLRTKKWRMDKSRLLYIKKLKLNSAYGISIISNGQTIIRPHWTELYKRNWGIRYKSDRKICGCFMCKGERYKRKNQLNKRLIDEEMEQYENT